MGNAAIGRKAPDFALPTDSGALFRLSEQRGHPVVLFFYPEDGTEGCTIESIEFSQRIHEFEELGIKVVGISPDSVEKHCKFRDKYSLNVPLAADTDRTVIDAYGAWGPKTLFGRAYDGVLRTTVLIDQDGNIAAIWPVRRIKGHAETALHAARALVAAAGG
jgi:thioredoxin-dependent peroxiredoxin